ncbi:MAG: pilus assembly protein [Parasphingorhabdus sp.]|nr:pilus assembly protein [Parasphingorhabdus sp.]
MRNLRQLGQETSAVWPRVEFGIISSALVMMLLGLLDLGYQAYVDSMVKSKLHQVARLASTGGMTENDIETFVKDELKPIIFDERARVDVVAKSYYAFSSIGKPEKITKDVNNNNQIDDGDCFIDGNGNDIFDVNYGRLGLGGPDDIVQYKITVDTPRFFPLSEFFGGENKSVTTNVTAVRNQPYGSQVVDPEVCKNPPVVQ